MIIEQNEKNGSRIQILDLAKGIGVFLVIAGHMPSLFSENIRLWIFSFHMPLFFLISGFFAKECLEKKDVVRALIGKTRKLLIPYFIYSCIYTLLLLISGDISVPGISEYALNIFLGTINGVQWFFLSLFLTSVFFVIITYLLKYEPLRFFVVIAIVAFGFFMGRFGVDNYFRLGSSCFSLGFYYLGYILKKYKDRLILKIKRIKWLLISLVAVTEIIVFLLGKRYLDLMCNYEMDILICYFVAVSGSAMVVVMAGLASNIFLVKDVIAYIGRFSLFFYPLTNYCPLFFGKILGDSFFIDILGYFCGFALSVICAGFYRMFSMGGIRSGASENSL